MIFTTIWSINRINQILKILYISFSNIAYEWTLCHTNDNLIYDNLHLQKLATKTRVWQTRLTIHFRESFATRLPLPSSRFTWKRKRNRWIECPSPHTEHSTRLYAHRGGKARPRYRCFERTPAGQSAVEQRCLSEAALFLSSSTVVARCTKLLAHPCAHSKLRDPLFIRLHLDTPRRVSASDKIHRIKWHVNTSYGLFSIRSIFRAFTWTYRAL